MRRKLGLIAAVALDRPILVLDEPMNGLDLAANLLLARLLRKLAEAGKTIVLTSHHLEELSASCDIVHVMANGHIVATHDGGAIEDIRASVETRELDLRRAALETLVEELVPKPSG
jgi:ABC-2 type transport system ATP-binding protein